MRRSAPRNFGFAGMTEKRFWNYGDAAFRNYGDAGTAQRPASTRDLTVDCGLTGESRYDSTSDVE